MIASSITGQTLKHNVLVLAAMALGGLLFPGDDQRADAWTIRQPNK
jgi:hypothetical protein